MVAPPGVTPAESARKKNFTRTPASPSHRNPFSAVESNFLSAAGNMAIQRAAAGPSAHNAAAASILGGANLDSGQCSCGGACDECKKKQMIQHKGDRESTAVASGFDAAVQRSGSGAPLQSASPNMESRFAGSVEDDCIPVSQPGDVYEQEADRAAEAISRMVDPGAESASVNETGRASAVQRYARGKSSGGTGQSEHGVAGMSPQRASAGSSHTATVPPTVHEVLRSPGQPLDDATRNFAERRFGRDFSQVRLHTDLQASESAKAVKAVAFTVGRDVVFGAGQYQPQTEAGRKLLTHELTHVVQQGHSKRVSSGASASTPQQAGASALPKSARMQRKSVAGEEDISFELAEAVNLPDVPTKLKDLSPAEKHVLAWLRKYQSEIASAEAERKIDRRAIAGAIAWEALKNVHRHSARAVGPGKVHVFQNLMLGGEETVAKQVEERGYIASHTIGERIKDLKSPAGAIHYVGAIMAAIADIAKSYDYQIRCDAPILTMVFQAWDLPAWEDKLSAKKNLEPLIVGPGMGTWVRDHLDYLEEAVGKPVGIPFCGFELTRFPLGGISASPAVQERPGSPVLQRKEDFRLAEPTFGQPQPQSTGLVSPGMTLSAPLVEVTVALVEETTRMGETGATLLPAEYIQSALQQRWRDAELSKIFNDGVEWIQGARGDGEVPGALVKFTAGKLIDRLELMFIRDPKASTLDLLPASQARRYREMPWDPSDFPGGPKGPNEAVARAMAEHLNRIRPERRANQGVAGLLVETRESPLRPPRRGDPPRFGSPEFDAAMEKYVQDEMLPVPNEEGFPDQHKFRLNRYALESFLEMRRAAQKDGIILVIKSSDRLAQKSKRMAAKAGNRAAVARFSSHNLGVAIDFRLSHGAQHFSEAATVPMQNVADMHQSPVHKWLFLHGAAYGWYPYHNEPWHWEYNPPGFRQQFFHYGDYEPVSDTEEIG